MKVSYEWLKTYFKPGEAPEASAIPDLLNFHSFEVESSEKVGEGDTLFDVKVLPNRAHDALSHWSIAWELATITRKKLDTSVLSERTDKLSDKKSSDFLRLSVENGSLVPRAQKRMVFDVVVGESPDWLKTRLASIGQRSINNVVDATNFLTHELGQPVHAFDYDKLVGREPKNITVRPAKDGEVVTTLDGRTFKLDSSVLVIADDEKALDIAGVKGGNNSGIDEKTKRIVLSACTFDGPTIRRTSQRLGLRTDASSRFEHGLSPHLVEVGMQRLTNLITSLTGGMASPDVLDAYPIPQELHEIQITPRDVERLLGLSMTENQITETLDRIGFTWKPGIVVEVPPTRLDLERTADLVEEVGRIYGYENVGAKAPVMTVAHPAVLKSYYYAEKIRSLLSLEGFSELYGYSFGETGERELENPLALNRGRMRSDLAPQLSERLAFNLRNKDILGLDEVRLFEIGNVYPKTGETTRVVLGSSNKKTDLVSLIPWKVENLYKGSENILEFSLSDLLPILPDMSTYADLPAPSSDTTLYAPFSPYPAVSRDVAVFVPVEVSGEQVSSVIEKEKGSLCVLGPRLFDTFTKTFPDGSQKTSYAFRLVFQAPDRTLTSEETTPIMDAVYKALTAQGWQIR